jgi:hypothetical protein
MTHPIPATASSTADWILSVPRSRRLEACADLRQMPGITILQENRYRDSTSVFILVAASTAAIQKLGSGERRVSWLLFDPELDTTLTHDIRHQ